MSRPPKSRTFQPEELRSSRKICFSANLMRPMTAGSARPVSWAFLLLPRKASARLPSRGMVAIEGALNGCPFQRRLEPDGKGGHWLKVDRRLQAAAGVTVGDMVTLEIAPSQEEPEPRVPADLRRALAAASTQTRATWSDITPAARRDWVHWITSSKRPETRARRVETTCDMLARGRRRPCCFDRSGIYGGSLGCPLPDTGSSKRRR
jgi:hypothetical protein